MGADRVRGPGALMAAGALALAGVVACSGGDESPPEPAAQTAPAAAAEGPSYEVETATETFVDESRPTEDPNGQLSAPDRTLETDLYVPEGAGPFPLVVQAHGFDGHPRKFTQLATAWAEAGYVVAIPAFPLTNDRAGGPTVLEDYVNQPADVAFVIDEVLRLAEAGEGDDSDGGTALAGKVDGDRIGLAGHSLGGATAYGLVFNDCCRDARVDAVALMSTLPLPFGEDRFRYGGTPMLLLQLTEDPIVPYDQAVGTYREAPAPKFLVTLEGGVHFEPYENVPSVHDDVVEEATIAFWDVYLGDEVDPDQVDADAVGRLIEAADSPGVSRVTADP